MQIEWASTTIRHTCLSAVGLLGFAAHHIEDTQLLLQVLSNMPNLLGIQQLGIITIDISDPRDAGLITLGFRDTEIRARIPVMLHSIDTPHLNAAANVRTLRIEDLTVSGRSAARALG